MSVNISIDLETLDVKPSAIVLSCGLVAFDLRTGSILGEQYTRFVDLGEQYKRGRTIRPATVCWWAAQSEEARAVLTAPVSEGVGTLEGLGQISDFFKLYDPVGVWGNGSDFDNAILGSLFTAYDLAIPWSYSYNRCMRTLKAVKFTKEFKKPLRVGTHHNALDDARYQAEYIASMCKNLNLTF